MMVNMIVRPERLTDFVGQKMIKDRLSISLNAARKEMRLPSHMLFTGPPGLGKTSMASVVAEELGIKFHPALSSNITSVKDLIQILKPVARDTGVVFIDEIHRLDKHLYEFLYSVLEDGYLTPLASTEKVVLKDFVFIGASTEEGTMPKPFLDRFGIRLEFERYSVSELVTIAVNYIDKVNVARGTRFSIESDAARMVAERSQGVPRIVLNLTNDVRDYAITKDTTEITSELTLAAFESLHVEQFGLSKKQANYMKLLAARTKATGVQEISVLLGESKETVERLVEPVLLHLRLVDRTSSGRILTLEGRTVANELR